MELVSVSWWKILADPILVIDVYPMVFVMKFLKILLSILIFDLMQASQGKTECRSTKESLKVDLQAIYTKI